MNAFGRHWLELPHEAQAFVGLPQTEPAALQWRVLGMTVCFEREVSQSLHNLWPELASHDQPKVARQVEVEL
jgi:hypothetical protein